jgi:hypothetical protein
MVEYLDKVDTYSKNPMLFFVCLALSACDAASLATVIIRQFQWDDGLTHCTKHTVIESAPLRFSSGVASGFLQWTSRDSTKPTRLRTCA